MFDLSGLPTATTRTLTAPDASGTVDLINTAQTVSGVKTFSAIPVMSGGGITFPATQVPSANANTLDDYEEGTFTPIIKGSTVAGTGTYASQDGRYTKIGDVVYFKLAVSWTAHTGSGSLVPGGLPFNASSSEPRSTLVLVTSSLALTASNYAAALKTANNADMSVEQMPVGGGALTAVPLDTSATILISGHYFV